MCRKWVCESFSRFEEDGAEIEALKVAKTHFLSTLRRTQANALFSYPAHPAALFSSAWVLRPGVHLSLLALGEHEVAALSEDRGLLRGSLDARPLVLAGQFETDLDEWFAGGGLVSPPLRAFRAVSRKPRENPGFSDFGDLYLGRIPVDSAPS